jgi:hypothetical protein
MNRYRAERAGELPSVDDVVLAGVRLPRGGLVVPGDDYAADVPTLHPVLWISAEIVEEVGGLWSDLAARFDHHGLWPLVLEPLDGDDTRPWDTAELDPKLSLDPASYDATAVLDDLWSQCMPESGDPKELAPHGRHFPGLAAATTGERTPIPDDVLGAEGRLGLVAATRAADVPSIVGWTGPLNYEADMGKLGAVMRSWEDRFGAYLIALGFDTMTFLVERPPTSIDHAIAIAAEHFAFCPDRVWQDVGSLQSLAESLVDAPLWHFWWD